MDIIYVAKQVEVVSEDRIRVAVEIKIDRVVNGYGGGVITLTVPWTGYQETIKAAVIRKFTAEVDPQKHDICVSGDLSKVEQLKEDLEVMDAQRRATEEARAAERAQRLQAAKEADAQAKETSHSAGIEEAPEDAIPLDEQSEPDVPSAPEEPSVDEVTS